MLKKLQYLFSYYTIFGFHDKATNKNFNDWKQEHSYHQITYISAVTGVLYILLSFVNRFTAPPEISSLISNLQLYVIAPYIFFVSFLGYKKAKFVFIEIFLFIAPIFAATLHIFIISKLDSYSFYQTELYLMIFWIFTLSGLRYTHSLITSLVVFFAGTIAAYTLYPDQYELFFLHTTWMMVSFIFGFAGGYLLQESQKNTFFKQMELEENASRDKLTGLYNRTKLDETLTQELERAQRYNFSIGIMILDIDFFKIVNDTHGHLIGDQILVKISKQIAKNIRSSDLVFRWGGEEFIIICHELEPSQIMLLAEKIRQSIEQINFDEVGQKTVSIGTTINHKDDTINSILKRADAALYDAKNSGRNCTRFA